jgi:hypothetical protein
MNNDELLKYYERQYGPFLHMAQNDKAIWMRYLIQGGTIFAPFEYDVRVGDGVTMPTGSTSQEIGIAFALTTKRIDAVCVNQNKVRIIEVKQRAGLSAIGQLLGYKELYEKSFAPPLECEMFLVTDELQPDMRPLLITNKIGFIEVGY